MGVSSWCRLAPARAVAGCPGPDGRHGSGEGGDGERSDGPGGDREGLLGAPFVSVFIGGGRERGQDAVS